MRTIIKVYFYSVLLIISGFLFCNKSYAQDVGSFIMEVRLDSIVKTVRELSGEDSVVVNNNKVLIRNRGDVTDNSLAAEYIKQRLQNYGLEIFEHNYSQFGTNIIGTQSGVGESDSILIICAHYDAVTTYCADDNASGCAAVIEAARILSESEFEHTIRYILFDEEEIGLVGSQAYVNYINWLSQKIISVINVEMLGYESNKPYDGNFDIITNNDSLSVLMSDVLIDIVDTYNLDLNPVTLFNISGSDHSSFWESGYPAICYSEAFHSGDPNPFYHTSNDRISQFHLPYFLELVRLGVGSLAKAAIPAINTNTDTKTEDVFTFYPNPCRSDQTVMIFCELSNAEVEVRQLLNGTVALHGFLNDGRIQIKANTLEPGVYVINLFAKNKMYTEKLIVL